MKEKLLPHKEKKRLLESYGDWAVVTGASSGIGLELAMRLAEAGFNLVINARNENNLEKIQAELRSKYNVAVQVVAADASHPEGVRKIIAASLNENVGLFVAAAGFGTSGLFYRNDIETEVDLLKVNCEAVLRLTHYYAQRFVKQQKGGIILLSSLVAFQGVPYAANYAASKAYIQSLAEALRIELQPYNVQVLSVAPGPVETGFGKRANMKMTTTLKTSEIGIPVLTALGRKTTVLPGLLSRLLVYALRTLPRWWKVKVMGKVMAGFVEHQKAPIG